MDNFYPVLSLSGKKKKLNGSLNKFNFNYVINKKAGTK